jgi:hypothetical protein
MQPVTAFAQEEPEEIFLEEDDIFVAAPEEAQLQGTGYLARLRDENGILMYDPYEGAAQYEIEIEGNSYYTEETSFNLAQAFFDLEKPFGRYSIYIAPLDEAGERMFPLHEYPFTFQTLPAGEKHQITTINGTSNIGEIFVAGHKYQDPDFVIPAPITIYKIEWLKYMRGSFTPVRADSNDFFSAGDYRYRLSVLRTSEYQYTHEFGTELHLFIDGQEWIREGGRETSDGKILDGVYVSPTMTIKEEPIEVPIEPEIRKLDAVTATSDIAQILDEKVHKSPTITDVDGNVHFTCQFWEKKLDDGNWRIIGSDSDNPLEPGFYRCTVIMPLNDEFVSNTTLVEGLTLTVDGQQWDNIGDYSISKVGFAAARFKSPALEVKGNEPVGPIDPGDPEDPIIIVDPPIDPVDPIDPIDPDDGEWVEKWGAIYYMTADGQLLTGMWNIDGELYYFNEKGIMQTCIFHKEDGKMYYFDSDGMAVSGWLERWVSTYYFDEDCVMQTGFVDIDGDTYYFDEHGHQMHSYWVTEGGNKYYIQADGTMAKGISIRRWGKKYSFDDNGVLLP